MEHSGVPYVSDYIFVVEEYVQLITGQIEHIYTTKNGGWVDRFIVGVLNPGNIEGHIKTSTDFRQCAQMVNSQHSTIGKSECWHNDPKFHSLTLSLN